MVRGMLGGYPLRGHPGSRKLKVTSVKAAVVVAPKDIRWKQVPDPVVDPGWVRVKTRAIGICSSDIPRALDGAAYHYPIVLGHEIAGEVVELGEGIDGEWLGKRVAVAPLVPCRQCRWCELGRYSLCDDYDYLGSRRDGGCSEHVVAPAANLLELPSEISFESGALLEPAAVALHGLRERVQSDDRVAVLGVGPLGLFAVQLSSLLGARRVLAIDPLAERLRIAESFGAIAFQVPVPQLNVGDLPELEMVVVAAGSPAAQAQALQLVGKGGRVLFLGIPKDEVRLEAALFERVIRHELQLMGSWNSYGSPFPGPAWRQALLYLREGRLRSEPLVTHRLPLTDAGSAYRLFRAGGQAPVKAILLNPG